MIIIYKIKQAFSIRKQGRLLLLMPAAVLLCAACATPQRVETYPSPADTRSPVRSGSPADNQEIRGTLHTDLIQNMLAQHQYYAALAHIEQLRMDSGTTVELRYLEAETRRQLSQFPAAEALYRGLFKTTYEGPAYHGLGLLYAARGDMKAAVQHLRLAAQRRPTDADVRNDLGYALMMSGRYREALPELSTAVELETSGSKARNNLLLLLMLSGDETGVKRVAADSAVSKDELVQLRKQAQSLQSRIRPYAG